MPPPGVFYALKSLPGLLLPAAVVYAAIYILDHHFDVVLSPWLTWLATCLSVPVSAAVKVSWAYFQSRREAAAMGAIPVPTWEGKWPGSFDLLLKLLEEWDNGYPAEGFWEPFSRLGPIFNFRLLWDDQIFTTQPEHIKAVLATDFQNYEKGSRFQEAMAAVLGTGVFNSDGEMWKFHRSMTRPFFSRDRISHFDIFERHADEAITLVKQRLNEGYAIDFQDVVSRFTLDSATSFLFGSCVHSLSAGLPYPHSSPNTTKTDLSKNHPANTFALAFSDAQYAISHRARVGPSWPLYELFKDYTKEPIEVVNRYLDPILREALEKYKASGGTKDGEKAEEVVEGETLLDHLVKFTSDTTILKDEILNIMIAGRDTTAATLTFVAYILATHPHVMERLRNEILTKVGPTQRPTYDNIRDMKYLRAVINETLRLFPPVPFNIRESIRATTLPATSPGGKPFHVPAKTSISYSVFMMHRRKDLWGPDAQEFDPDRFLDARVHKYLTPNPFIFLPFNAGPRICLGQQFAYNETSFMLIRLLQNFSSISLNPEAQPADSHPPKHWATHEGRQATEKFYPKMHLTMYANKGLWVKMTEASGEAAAI